jgi:hypothetical protein
MKLYLVQRGGNEPTISFAPRGLPNPRSRRKRPGFDNPWPANNYGPIYVSMYSLGDPARSFEPEGLPHRAGSVYLGLDHWRRPNREQIWHYSSWHVSRVRRPKAPGLREIHSWLNHTPKPDIVVTIVWLIVVAVGRADVLFIIVPTAPAQHLVDLSPRSSRQRHLRCDCLTPR